jgi:hypothetical protein
MPIEHLTYAQIAERLSVSTEAARAIVKRHRVPRSRSNDGKTLAAIDLQEIRHKPLPARPVRSHRSVSDVVAALKARIAKLEAELVVEQQRSVGHRADYERERERAERMVTIQDGLIGELENLRSLLEAAQQSARPVTTRTWHEMSWPERRRWVRATGCLAGAGLLLALSTVPAGAQPQQPQQQQPPRCFTVEMSHSTQGNPQGSILLDRCTGKTWLLLCIRNDSAGCAFRWAPIPDATEPAGGP